MKRTSVVIALLVLAAFPLVASAQPGRGHRGHVIRFFDEVWTNGNLAVVDEMVDPSFSRYAPTSQGTVIGIPEFKALIQRARGSFSEYTITLEEMEGIGDKATIQWRLRGTYVGPNNEIPSGRAVDLTGTSIWTMKNGKILREIVEWDEAEYYRQIEMALPYEEIKNRALVLSLLFDLFGEGNLDAASEILAADHILHDPGNVALVGPHGFANRALAFRTAFPDLGLTIHEMVADGNVVSTRWTMKGTHNGEWRNIAPTGRSFKVSGLTFCLIEDGQIAETWSIWDREDMRDQLGG